MSLKIAIQMDPMHSINIHTDSSFMMALEAQKRGYQLYHYLPQMLSLRDGKLSALAHELRVQYVAGAHYQFGAADNINLADMDVVLMRQDPPFHMGYITATHLLDHVRQQTLVVNDPTEVRNAPEKLFVTHFADLLPPTLITRNVADIQAFRREFDSIIIKPLFGNGGAGVFHLKPGDDNLNALLEMFFTASSEPVMVQRYEPAVRQGDKRIILIEGRPVGAINRVPASGEARANLHVGGRAEQARLTARDEEICDRIGAELRARGLIFVGIDVIGDYITEINVTSPTGIQEINRFDKVALEAQLWDAIEERLHRRQQEGAA